ncbi:MAG: SIR2 family protein [Pseudomonadota bacterium]
MEPSNASEILSRALVEDRLVALVGSAASASYVDPNKRQYQGLPTPKEFVKIAAKQFGYIKDHFEFNDTCDRIVDQDGRAKLEEFLVRYYKVQRSFEVPPCHGLLSWLPFSQYISANYDELIELSLSNQSRRPYVIVEDSDLAKANRRDTRVIKYHGCVNRPSTLVAATRDYDALDDKRNLVRDNISSSLAGKDILVVGHGLGDEDLHRILKDLTNSLGEYAPKIYILRGKNHDGRMPTLGNLKFEIIREDMTIFLNRLLHSFRNAEAHSTDVDNEGSWFSSSFFSSFQKDSVLPSETQVIDAFLDHLLGEISARPELNKVLADAEKAVKSALRERPNYGALLRIWGTLKNQFTECSDSVSAELLLEKFKRKRNNEISRFNDIGSEIIRRNERVLIYSQSQRVLQVLKGVPRSVQKTVHVFVAECRPKSPQQYKDAIATCRELESTSFKLTVCPDVVALSMLGTKQITRIVIGTHAIFRNRRGQTHSFVNTCGTHAIVQCAQEHTVPIDVIGEELKIEYVTKKDASSHVHLVQEDDLKTEIIEQSLKTNREEVGHLNIGYDLVPVEENITIHIPSTN